MLFGNGRAAFLEFLRNLTPQILLFTIALAMASKLNLTHISFSWEDLWHTLPFILVIFTFLSAAIANITLFIEKAATSVDWVNEKSKELQSGGVRGVSLIMALLKLVAKNNPKFFIEILLTFLVAQVGLVAVLIASIPAAANIIGQMR